MSDVEAGTRGVGHTCRTPLYPVSAHSSIHCFARGFVKMSAIFSTVLALMISRFPLQIWSWKWWYLIEMCFVLGLNCMSVVAKMMHALLSSNILVGGSLEACILSTVEEGINWIKLYCSISWSTWRKGSKSLVAIESAIYSLSVIDKAISLWSLLHQVTGHPQKVIT